VEDSKTESNAASPKKSRVRFSLRRMFVGAIVLTLIASNIFTSWHLQQARQTVHVQQMEINALRKELRFLDTSDKENVHVVALESPHELTWKWRIYVPQDRKLALKSVIGNLPLGDFPENTGFMWIHPGELVLTCMVSRNAIGEWTKTIRIEQDGSTSDVVSTIPAKKMDWYSQAGTWGESGILLNSGQQTFSGTDNVSLVWHRKIVNGKPGQIVDPQQPSEGIVFWLEPRKD